MIFAAADFHLDKALRQDSRELLDDSFEALKKLQDLIFQQVKSARRTNREEQFVLLLAGDTTDKNRITGTTVKFLRDFVSALQFEGVQVCGIEGNHDIQNQNREKPVPFIEAVGGCHINEKLKTLSGMTVYGLDWRPAEKLKDALAKVPPCDILVMHQPFQHLLSFEDAYDVSLDDIPRHVKCVISGDIHKAQYLQPSPGRPAFISPGSLHPCDIGQNGVHGMYVGSLAEMAPGKAPYDCLIWKQVPIISRPLLDVELKAKDEAELTADILQALSTVPLTGMKPVVKLTHPPEIGAALRNVLSGKDLAGKAVYIPEPRYNGKISEARPTIEIKLTSLSLREAVPLVADPVTDKTTNELLLMCVDSQNLGMELDAWVAKRMEGVSA